MKQAGWKRQSLAALCSAPDDIRCGPFGTQLNKSEFRAEGVPLWGIKQVNAQFRIGTSEFLEEETAERLRQYDLRPGDLVMTRKGTVGNCAVYPPHFQPGIMHSDLLRIRIDATRCDPSFLVYQLHHSSDVARQLSLISGGAIMPGINVGRLKELEVVAPPVEEQKRIAAILDKADAIRRKRQQALRLTDDFLRAVFLEMFGDPVTNPKRWDVRDLNWVIGNSFRNGLSPSNTGTVAGKVLTLTAITSGTFAPEYVREAFFDRVPSQNQMVTADTFLICRGNGNKSMVGIGVFPGASMEDVAFPDTMIACTIDRTRIEPGYLQAVWSTIHVRRQVEAGARTTNGTFKVNQTLLGSIEFPLPPVPVQRTFSDIAKASRSKAASDFQATASAELLFSSLQQRAFRGEL